MSRRVRFIIISFGVLLVLGLTLPIFVVGSIYDQVFGVRIDHKASVIATQLAEADMLTRQEYKFKSNKGQELTGYLYTSIDEQVTYRGLVVLSHGLGCGHIDYMFDIDYFAQHGYKVFAYDNTGCNESGGDSLIGLKQSPIDLDYALNFINSHDDFAGLPIMLYGHSWGGYAVTSVLTTGHEVNAVVSRSGFNRSHDVLVEQGGSILGEYVNILSPYFSLYELYKFGFDAPAAAMDGIDATKAPIMLLHSLDDDVISIQSSLYTQSRDCADQERITRVLYENKGHDIVRSTAAIDHISDCKVRYDAMLSKYGGFDKVPNDVLNDYFRSVDVNLSNEIDEELMQMLVDFFDSAL